MRNQSFDIGALQSVGIHLPGVQGFFDDLPAMDAQTALITTTSSGIPAYLANFVSPKLIEVLTAPNKAAKIFGETQMGSWIDATLTFPMVEFTGEVSSYGDYSENGSTGLNTTFPQRQPYHYQTISQWGERQLEVAGLAKIDYANKINLGSANVLNKFQNDTYFYGVAGLQCYGALNDPALSAAITPGNKVFNANASGPWITGNTVTATADEIYADIQSLFSQLVSQTNNLIDEDAPLVLAMAPGSSVALLKTNQYNVNVRDQIAKNFPNLRIETAPQYATSGGNLVQLIVESIDGEEVATTVYTEKLRAHRIVADTSSFKQKKSQGTAGTVIFRPMGIAAMLGV